MSGRLGVALAPGHKHSLLSAVIARTLNATFEPPVGVAVDGGHLMFVLVFVDSNELADF